MTIHAQRLEAVPILAHAQIERGGDLPGIQPDLERVVAGFGLFHGQGGDVPALDGQLPAARECHAAGHHERKSHTSICHLGPAFDGQGGIACHHINQLTLPQQVQTVLQVHARSAILPQ